MAMRAFARLEKSRSGAALIEKLCQLSDEDIEGLDKLLGEWTIRDALTILEEIDRRIAVVEAIRRFSEDEHADELRTLHPLVTDARWLFGPEFDSPEYASNLSLRLAIEKVFGSRIDGASFLNPRKRPDLLVLGDASLSAVAIDKFDPETGLNRLSEVLLLELKKESQPSAERTLTKQEII